MQLDETVQGIDGIVVHTVLILREGGHQLGLGRPGGIRVLALDFVEQPRRLLVVLEVELIERAVIELFDRLLDIDGPLIVAAAGQGQDEQAGGQQAAEPAGAKRKLVGAWHGWFGSGGVESTESASFEADYRSSPMAPQGVRAVLFAHAK